MSAATMTPTERFFHQELARERARRAALDLPASLAPAELQAAARTWADRLDAGAPITLSAASALDLSLVLRRLAAGGGA